jgi:methylated-DNA-[protein]-cysteine S-methyltransferase
MERTKYIISSSSYGAFAILWKVQDGQPRIQRITLPGKTPDLESVLTADYPLAEEGFHSGIKSLSDDICGYLDGAILKFDLHWLDWEKCTDFQVRVLRAEYGIPRGWVSTYGRIAAELDVPGGARAVGSALATNPFPLMIPCHRAVRSSGELGGYQGGLEMKRALLEMEGVEFQSPTRVSLKKVFY